MTGAFGAVQTGGDAGEGGVGSGHGRPLPGEIDSRPASVTLRLSRPAGELQMNDPLSAAVNGAYEFTQVVLAALVMDILDQAERPREDRAEVLLQRIDALIGMKPEGAPRAAMEQALTDVYATLRLVRDRSGSADGQ